MPKIEINIPEENYKEIKLISEMKGKEPKEIIEEEIILTFRSYLEDCKNIIG